ncbi:DUF1232 domain-containing protein [Pseudomonas fulva]|uniref:YkvA family protein n=1 Tax=Pseudomonas fulva TaxID=47880 RepID=UPI00201DE566|nr:DUF1232 domain-containing protein [Pseudomonas fulva]UQY36152.1 DUF1232 domain-containing protein [Pseudomonas fulva]
MSQLLQRLGAWARQLKRQTILLWLCCRQPEMPWPAKLVGIAVVLYAVSPVDLVPDFVPVLGLLDDLLLLPLGIALAVRLTPPSLIQRCRPEAERLADTRIGGIGRWMVAALVVLAWVLLAALLWHWLQR